ncbi:hypothetical protein BCV72DRAFT_251534 [Rhizopus microsporus var. microsporus]|uniref:Uncharacterized protein n=1 Tax=Rhizopus microsporus var. microsporus TaxID=86635 RepID=A0A1X0QW44_RHIZD|nr:hypothetical protein BCV72DRAFT_251534 [Rhizopus microsporus var. microsporus]
MDWRQAVFWFVLGCFGPAGRSKASYDHHKSFFWGLAILKGIVDGFSMANLKTFEKVEVFFVHGENTHLWNLCFESQGPLFELWFEDTLVIRPHISDKLEALSSFCLLAESVLELEKFKTEHVSSLAKNILTGGTLSKSLSNVINPSIVKLLEEEKAGMHLLGPIFGGHSLPWFLWPVCFMFFYNKTYTF